MADPRTLILSDLHLAKPASELTKIDQLRPLWAGMDRLIINGDLAEVQASPYREEACEQVNRLIELCEADGVKLTIISGNHDAPLTDTRHVMLADGKILVTHGDVFSPGIAPWTPQAKELAEQTREKLESVDTQDLRARLKVSQQVAEREFDKPEVSSDDEGGIIEFIKRPYLAIKLLWYWWTIPGKAARFAQRYRPAARVVIFGHSHRQGHWVRRRRLIINTGAFMFPGKPRAVLLEGSRLTVHDVKLQNKSAQLQQEPIFEFDLL
jgi:predicted phosphodiesterase